MILFFDSNITIMSFDIFIIETKINKAGWMLKDGRRIVDVLATKTTSLVSDKSKKKHIIY